jgi:hypothetical protein
LQRYRAGFCATRRAARNATCSLQCYSTHAQWAAPRRAAHLTRRQQRGRAAWRACNASRLAVCGQRAASQNARGGTTHQPLPRAARSQRGAPRRATHLTRRQQRGRQGEGGESTFVPAISPNLGHLVAPFISSCSRVRRPMAPDGTVSCCWGEACNLAPAALCVGACGEHYRSGAEPSRRSGVRGPDLRAPPGEGVSEKARPAGQKFSYGTRAAWPASRAFSNAPSPGGARYPPEERRKSRSSLHASAFRTASACRRL